MGEFKSSGSITWIDDEHGNIVRIEDRPMDNKVTRYTRIYDEMEPYDDGEWVKFEEYEKLCLQLSALIDARDGFRESSNRHRATIESIVNILRSGLANIGSKQ